MTETEIIEALRENKPFNGLRDVRVLGVIAQPRFQGGEGLCDLDLTLDYGGQQISVYGEVKSACTPKMVGQIAPWLASLKKARKDAAVALICPALSPEAQAICAKYDVDFIDLAGNVSIRVPGRLLIQRVGLKAKGPALFTDPFSGKASRVLRVLLRKPTRSWRITELAGELVVESGQSIVKDLDFKISLASVSKTLKSLEEDLFVRRQGSKIMVPEPRRLLLQWAAMYRQRLRWRFRSYKCQNPFGPTLKQVTEGIKMATLGWGGVAFTGAAAADTYAPYVDLDTIDLYEVGLGPAGKAVQRLQEERPKGPDLRIIDPPDIGVFLYADLVDGVPIVSPVQAYLDLVRSGGRDLKQAEYLLSRVIEPLWSSP